MATKLLPSMRFFGLFALFSFVTGFVLIVASQRNTERRSQASNGPYACDVVCSPAAGGIGGAACILYAGTDNSVNQHKTVSQPDTCRQMSLRL